MLSLKEIKKILNTKIGTTIDDYDQKLSDHLTWGYDYLTKDGIVLKNHLFKLVENSAINNDQYFYIFSVQNVEDSSEETCYYKFPGYISSDYGEEEAYIHKVSQVKSVQKTTTVWE